MKILIVEDDKVSSEILLRVFSGYGTCDVAINGIEAIDAFTRAYEEGIPYDLVSLDLMLPLIDGENVLAVIREIEVEKKTKPINRVKVIITSALNDSSLTAQLVGYGYDRYFLKPIDLGKVLDFMKSL